MNKKPVVTLWGAGGHFGEQHGLCQSGRWLEPPVMVTSKTEGGSYDWLPIKTDKSREHAALSRVQSGLSAPGLESHDRRSLGQTLCVAFVCGCFEVLGVSSCDLTREGRSSSSSEETCGSGSVSLPITMEFLRECFLFFFKVVWFFALTVPAAFQSSASEQRVNAL